MGDEVMHVWTCIDHEALYPVGCASVVVAETEAQAREILAAELVKHGLTRGDPFTLQILSLDEPHALVLQDGDY